MSMSGRPPPSPEAGASARPDQVLRRLEWTALRRLDGLLHGDYRSLFRGEGMDLADLREYQYADDVRHIDWNVTARLQVPHVREYHEDRELAAWFVLDLSGSVDFGSGAAKKLAVATDFTALLARVLTRRGNRVGAILYGSEVEAVIPPRSGRTQVLHVMSRMGRRRALPARGSGTDLRTLLATALQVVRRRALVFVVSDFISAPGWAPPLAQLAQRNDVVAIRLIDPLERALPDLGLVLMQDAETGEQLYVDTGDAAFRRRFETAAQAREEALFEAFAGAGVDALELGTDDDLVATVLRFAEMRKRRTQRSGAATAGTRSRFAAAGDAAHLEHRS
jgi:uncharacterized protein (DUF58 family)